MCINFNGYHSGGSSFLIVNGCWFKNKKKKKIGSPSIWFRTPKPVRIRQSGQTGIGGVTNPPMYGPKPKLLNCNVFSPKSPP